jgi:hypothetical protein
MYSNTLFYIYKYSIFNHLRFKRIQIMANVGYIRVSTVDQNTVRQLDGIELDKTYSEYASGKNKTENS